MQPQLFLDSWVLFFLISDCRPCSPVAVSLWPLSWAVVLKLCSTVEPLIPMGSHAEGSTQAIQVTVVEARCEGGQPALLSPSLILSDQLPCSGAQLENHPLTLSFLASERWKKCGVNVIKVTRIDSWSLEREQSTEMKAKTTLKYCCHYKMSRWDKTDLSPGVTVLRSVLTDSTALMQSLWTTWDIWKVVNRKGTCVKSCKVE